MGGAQLEIFDFLKWVFATYGAAALPYSVIAFLVWLVLSEKKKETVPPEYQAMINHYHEAIVENTRTIERLAVLIEERTRRQTR